jgi:hypothetical protein
MTDPVKLTSPEICRNDLRTVGWFTIAKDGGRIVRWKHPDQPNDEYTFVGAQKVERFNRER